MSRTPTKPSSAKPSPESSGYDYDAAERARLEAQRKKEIEENKKYIKDIQETCNEIKELRAQIDETKTLLANAVSGEKYNEYIKDLEEQDKCLAQISSDLNERAKQAAINIRKKGEECIFCEKNTEPAHNTSRDNNRPLSVNTDELQKAVVMLTDINTRSKSICDKVSDITGDSKKLGIQNSDNSEDKSRNVVDITVTLRDKLQQQIKETERTEKENIGIVDKIYDWFSGFFKSSDDKKLKDLDTDAAREEHREQKKLEAEEAIKKLIKEQSGTDAARAEQFAIKNNSAKSTPGSRTINAAPRDISELKGMSEIITVAKANDVSIKGKSKREILEELAIKYNVPTSVSLKDKVWERVLEFENKISSEEWSYAPFPEWMSVEEGINWSGRRTHCGGLVSIPLIQAGFLTEDDLRASNGGIQYNGPATIRDALIAKGCEKITDPNELQPGDILCYCDVGPGWGKHIEWFAEYGEGKKVKVYSAGGPGMIKAKGPTDNDLSDKVWEAYRLPEETITKTTDELAEDVLNKAQNLDLSSPTSNIEQEQGEQPTKIDDDWEIPQMKN